MAVPKVESGALLMVTFTAPDTDQVTFERFDVTAAHPEGRSPPNATKRCEFPGGGAAWSTVAVGGETLTDPKEHSIRRETGCCCNIAISNNVGGVKHFLSALRHALGEERHFALVDGLRFPTLARF